MKKWLSLIIFIALIVGMFVCGSSAAAEESKLNIPDEIPETITYEGKGDSVIKIKHPEGAFVLYIKGNKDGRHFAVKGYNSNGDRTELFVNTSDPYEGVTLDPSQETVTLEITAKGKWKVEVRSIWTCDIISELGTYKGKGDSVVLLNVDATIAEIEGNKDSRHFAIKSYGDRTNLMVNTSDEYSGTVMMKYNPYLLEVTAVGKWSITLE